MNNNALEIAKLLINHPKVEINTKDFRGILTKRDLNKTPLHYAAENDTIETIKMLLTRPNIDLNSFDFQDILKSFFFS